MLLYTLFVWNVLMICCFGVFGMACLIGLSVGFAYVCLFGGICVLIFFLLRFELRIGCVIV